MKLAEIMKSKLKDQRGVTAVIVAISITMLLGFGALAIDIGYLYATKTELQNVADAAALAGAGKLGEIYSDPTIDPETYIYVVGNPDLIRSSAQGVVGEGKNRAGAKNIQIRDEDIYINNFLDSGTTFAVDNYNQPDAVRVIARRDTILNTNVSTFFARIFNIDSLPVSADATAALTGAAKIAEGGLPIPIGIAAYRFETEYCDKPIYLHPTNDPAACAGWHMYEDSKGKLKQEILPGLIDGSFISPEVNGGDLFEFDGGVKNPVFVLLEELFIKNRDLTEEEDPDNKIDLDDDPDTWTTSVVVYDWDNCDNPNTAITIIGFSTITIYGVCHATTKPCTFYHDDLPIEGITVDDKGIAASVVCNYVELTRGGGGEYGKKGAIPNLIE